MILYKDRLQELFNNNAESIIIEFMETYMAQNDHE